MHSFPKGGTLKVTTVVFSNEVCSAFNATSSRTLLSEHVSRDSLEFVTGDARTGGVSVKF